MGIISVGKCRGCGYESRLFVGGGLRDCEPSTALAIANNDAGLADALAQNAWFQIDRRPALCGKCQKICSGALVTFEQPDGTKQTIFSTCPDCGGTLEYYSFQTGEMTCPRCGESFVLAQAGHWD